MMQKNIIMHVEALTKTGINYVANLCPDTLDQVGSILYSMQDLLRDTLQRNCRSMPHHELVVTEEQPTQEPTAE